MAIGKNLLIGVGAVAALYGLTYVLKLKRLSSELESVTQVSINKVSLSGMELRIDITLKNPSGGSLRVKHPFVKLMFETRVIGSSELKNEDTTISKFTEASFNSIYMSLNFISLATIVPKLLKEYRETGKLTLTVETITTINNSLPYSKTDKITLGGGKAA